MVEKKGREGGRSVVKEESEDFYEDGSCRLQSVTEREMVV